MTRGRLLAGTVTSGMVGLAALGGLAAPAFAADLYAQCRAGRRALRTDRPAREAGAGRGTVPRPPIEPALPAARPDGRA
jgi:hypothetical protein